MQTIYVQSTNLQIIVRLTSIAKNKQNNAFEDVAHMTGVNNSPFRPSDVQLVKHRHSFASVHLQTMRNCESDKPGSVGHETDADGWGEDGARVKQVHMSIKSHDASFLPPFLPSFLLTSNRWSSLP